MADLAGDTLSRSPSRASVRRDVLIDELITLFIDQGFLRLSMEDLARELKRSKSTLYTVADSKEQIFVAVARAFFRRATARIEIQLRDSDERMNRISSYLKAISEEFALASPQYFAELDEFAPTREIYRANMDVAARRVQQLVLEAVPQTSSADAMFVGAVAGQIMEAIHRGEIEHSTGLAYPAAYRALGGLIAAATTVQTATIPADESKES